MTRQLYLLRHAKAEAGAGGRDAERPLAPRGIEDAQALADWLAGRTCDRICYSSAVRTTQTYQGLEGVFGATLAEAMDAMYLASCGDLMTLLQEQDDANQSIMLIGHNPGMHELALTLATPNNGSAYGELELSLPTCGFIALECPIDHWQELAPQCARLQELWIPRLGHVS